MKKPPFLTINKYNQNAHFPLEETILIILKTKQTLYFTNTSPTDHFSQKLPIHLNFL